VTTTRWSDELLAALQDQNAPFDGSDVGLDRGSLTELYRLARLGLAAEQVGRTPLKRMANFAYDNQGPLKPLIDHPAWRKLT
jgi:hypothetical protein